MTKIQTGSRSRVAGALAAVSLTAAMVTASASWSAEARPVVDRREVLGTSVQGRAIRAVERGDPGANLTVLVVGCIHGDEPAGIAVAKRLIDGRPPSGVDLWVVPNLNPDGVVAHSRGNAHGVDLNRNFPFRWARLPRGRYFAGPRPLSEPESRIARALVARVRPDVTIWFHQPFGVVDLSDGTGAVERWYAHEVGLPSARLGRRPGSASGWSNHRFPGTTAFVVELPEGRLATPRVGAFADAVLALVEPRARGR